jgi:hypothetical protein
MRLGDLTTIASFKQWWATTSYSGAGADDLIESLISNISADILAYLERPWILPQNVVNEAHDGTGSDHMFMRYWPVNSVSAVSVNGFAIPANPLIVNNQPQPAGYGYRFETWDGFPPGGNQQIMLIGAKFRRGKQNVLFSYNAGYTIFNELQAIPSGVNPDPPFVVVRQPFGIWGSDVSVTYATGSIGTPLTAAAAFSQTLPAGEYFVIQPDTSPNPLTHQPSPAPSVYYVFSPNEAPSTKVNITYGYIPRTLEQAARQLVGERMVDRQHVGETQRMVGGGQAGGLTIKYDTADIPSYIKTALQRYRNILPI